MSALIPFDVLLSDLIGCLDASGVDAVGKLAALSMVVVASAQAASPGESGAMRQARDALGDAAARYAGAAIGLEVRDE